MGHESLTSLRDRREAEARNYGALVERQKTIARIYRPPRPAHTAQAAVVRRLEAHLEALADDDVKHTRA